MLTAVLKAVQDAVLTALKAVQDAEKNHPHKDQVQRLIPIILMLCPGAGLEQNKESSHNLKPVHKNDMAHLKLGNLLP
jgi:hypothetical protein